MEFLIGIAIGVIIGAILKIRKRVVSKKNSVPYAINKANTSQETPGEKRRRETDELVTTILPTIGNDR